MRLVKTPGHYRVIFWTWETKKNTQEQVVRTGFIFRNLIQAEKQNVT